MAKITYKVHVFLILLCTSKTVIFYNCNCSNIFSQLQIKVVLSPFDHFTLTGQHLPL